MKIRSSALWRCVLLVACLFLSGFGVSAQQPEKQLPLVSLDLPAPEIVSTPADWINTNGKSVPFEPGRVYVVHFWAFGCINCKRNLPAYGQWQQKYANAPLTVIGIHTPETDREKVPKNVADETRKFVITYPVVIDGQSTNWKRWQQQMWPTVYLIDKRGHVRAYWIGELEWQGAGGTHVMEGLIEQLLAEPSPPQTWTEIPPGL